MFQNLIDLREQFSEIAQGYHILGNPLQRCLFVEQSLKYVL